MCDTGLCSSNSLLLVTSKLGKLIVQDLRIHWCMLLSTWPLLLNRWAPKLPQIYENIMLLMQMFHNQIFGQIGCITSFNVVNKHMPIFLPSHAFLGNPMWHICWVKPAKKKNNKGKIQNVLINYLKDEGIAPMITNKFLT